MRDGDRLTNPRVGSNRVTLIVSLVLVFLLTLSNVATLLSERVHDAAFGILASVLGVAGQVAAESILARSPTKAKARAVDVATRQIQFERADLLRKNNVLRAETEAVKVGKAALVQERNGLLSVAAKRAATVRAVAARTSTILATRAAEAVSTLPVRAAPYVGIGALVGFTTYELKMDCDVARALAELNAEHGNAPIDTGQVCTAIDRVPSPRQTWDKVIAEANSALSTTYTAIESTAKRIGLTLDTNPLK